MENQIKELDTEHDLLKPDQGDAAEYSELKHEV